MSPDFWYYFSELEHSRHQISDTIFSTWKNFSNNNFCTIFLTWKIFSYTTFFILTTFLSSKIFSNYKFLIQFSDLEIFFDTRWYYFSDLQNFTFFETKFFIVFLTLEIFSDTRILMPFFQIRKIFQYQFFFQLFRLGKLSPYTKFFTLLFQLHFSSQKYSI